MAKSNILLYGIAFVISLIVVLITALLNNICCLFSPLAIAVLGAAAGVLCVAMLKPVSAEKAAAAGAITGAIAGAGALIGQTIGETIAYLVVGEAASNAACIPGLCNMASTPVNHTSWVLYGFFLSCFCGMLWLALMAGLGALGGYIFYRIRNKRPAGTPSGTLENPSH